MKPRYEKGSVVALCPKCRAPASFEARFQDRELGSTIVDEGHELDGEKYGRTIFRLLRCATCGRGGLAEVHANNKVEDGALGEFYPVSVERTKVPEKVPKKVAKEFEEAELCASFEAYRAATALLRSTMEKTLKANGYTMKRLEPKIDAAQEDGIITEARARLAHDDVRVLGNDILHDEWRPVTEEEFSKAYIYTQRVLEDFYTDRETVERMLAEKGRLQSEDGGPVVQGNEGKGYTAAGDGG